MISDEQQPNDQEMAALELYHQMVNLSADNGDRALMVTLRLPNGRYIGDVWLSTQDVQDLSDASVGLAAVREHTEATQTDNLPDQPDQTQLDAELRMIEDFANGGTTG
ncbi:hypothetical protein [Streptomyces scabiei]|uniref:hypothetical protein n=1 Tax=Streptomyces scabiei TaxID=1930 RepID=UPI0029B0C50E|nr:hypothetical protein [Streptomyces scabiei]MDX2997977.1 hypothetical protein [Streptomyces scabiei]MDX3051597.1 hypothetical protein [Streptomyces scabiei]